MYANLGPGHMAALDPPSASGVDVLYNHSFVADRMRRQNLYGYVSNNALNMVDPMGLLGQITPWQPLGQGNACSQAQFDEVKNTLQEVCAFINGKDAPKCIGPNLLKCLKTVCAQDFIIHCKKKCVDAGGFCASATIYDTSKTPPKDTTSEHFEKRGPVCGPKWLTPKERYGLEVCMIRHAGLPGEEPGWPQDPQPGKPGKLACGTSRKLLILHELVHDCNLTHYYGGGGGEPEACERSCSRFLGEYDPNYKRFRETPDKCRCECTPGR